MAERNALVASGEFVRVFVAEVQPGEVDAFGETVASVVFVGERVGLSFESGRVASYRDPAATILIRTDSIRDEG